MLLLLWEGWRRGFALRPWLTLVAASSLALILGTKLITHPMSEWSSVLFSNAPTDMARSILGGGLAAVLAVLGLRHWLGLPWAVLDALALPLCAALVVQCMGCVLTGCCFGEPTTGWRETVYPQSGLGLRTGRSVLAGIAAPTDLRLNILGSDQTELPGPMGFVSGQVPLPHTSISLEPTLLSGFGRNHQVNLRVNWQLPIERR